MGLQLVFFPDVTYHSPLSEFTSLIYQPFHSRLMVPPMTDTKAALAKPHPSRVILWYHFRRKYRSPSFVCTLSSFCLPSWEGSSELKFVKIVSGTSRTGT
jgi:hypothetical protein